MKNKKNIFKIGVIIASVLILSIIILALLGLKERKGYLSEFNVNINKTLQINGLDVNETKQLFTVDNKLDEDAIINYISTNKSITNYSYSFKVKYYSKIFRNSDIYGVYPNLNNLPEYIQSIKMNDNSGTPFGNFVSTKIMDSEKIDNINYILKLKKYFWIVFIFVLLYISFNAYKLIFFNRDKKFIFKICKITYILILFVLILLFILGKLDRKASLENLQLIADTKVGYVYQARIVSTGLFSDNFIYNYTKILSFDKKQDYIRYGYNFEFNTAFAYDKTIGLVFNNDDGTFTVSNSTGWNAYIGYDLELSKGEKYVITLEGKKISGTVIDTIKYDLNYWDNFTYIPNTDKMTDDYQIYVSEIEIKKDKISERPSIQFRFPKGIFNIKSIKIEQDLENLYLKSGNTIIFTSSQKINDISSLGYVNYNLNIDIYIIVAVFVLFLCMLILLFNKKLSNILNNLKNYLENYLDFSENNNLIIFSDTCKKYKISNILFIIYLIILGFIIFSINFVNGPNNDIFWFGTNYNAFYNIYDFQGNFWERGRHFIDIVLALYMRPFGTILINVFNIDPFKSLMISKSLFSVFYALLTSISLSLFIWTLNNKKNYKLIFLLISLYICNYANINYYITLACYIGGFGFSMLVFYPMIYYFIYDKEILIFKNKNMNYMLYFLLLYFATFSMEPTSTTLAGFSFFIILYIFIRRNKLFIDNNDSKPNIYILFILLSTIILTITSFFLTAFLSGRGKWQSQRISNTTVVESIINKFSSLAVFNKILILFGILYLIYFLFISLKNKKIFKENYICFSICFTDLFLILFFYSIDVSKIWPQLILLFSLFIIVLLKNMNNQNMIFSLFSNFIIFFLIFTMSLNVLKLHDNTLRYNNTTFRDWNVVIQIYKDAYNNNEKEIIITKSDIDKLKLGKIFYKPAIIGYGYDENPNTSFNKMLSEFMQRYYINTYIPIKVFYD